MSNWLAARDWTRPECSVVGGRRLCVDQGNSISRLLRSAILHAEQNTARLARGVRLGGPQQECRKAIG